MASITWPSTLADVLVSGAIIRGRGLQAWHSMNQTLTEYPDGTPTYFQDAWATVDGWTGDNATVTAPGGGVLRGVSTSTTYNVKKASVAYSAGTYTIRVRVRKTAGVATSNTSRVYIVHNSGATLTDTNYIPFTALNEWVIFDAVLTGLVSITTVGITTTGTGIAIGDTIEMDWFYIGDGTYATLLADDSGNGNTGTMTAVLPVTGVSGNGIYFNGVNSRIVSTLNPTDIFTFHCVLPSGNASSALTQTIFSYGLVSAPFIWVYRLASTDNIRIAFWNGSATGITISSVFTGFSSSSLTLGIMIDFTNGMVHIYRNGILFNSSDITGSIKPTSGTFNIGAYQGAGSNYLLGTIDEPRIYNRALSQQDIIELYNKVTTYEALPEYPDYDGFGEVPQNGTIRSSVDSGPPKVRRRFTALTTIYNVQYQLTQNQKQLLDYFYRTTTAQGSLPFNFNVPDGNTVEARFLTQPSFSAQEQGAIASFQIEVLP